MSLSIVIPCRNEAGNVKWILNQISEQTSHLRLNIEIIFVDDYSEDETWHEISKAVAARPQKRLTVRGVRLGVKSGQQMAIANGYSFASGEYVLSMDADGQHPAKYISEFWNMRSKDRPVIGVQRNRKSSIFYSLLSRMFYRLFRILSSMKIIESGGDFRLVTKELAKFISNRASSSMVIRFLIAEKGLRVNTVTFDAESRHSGSAAYSKRDRIKLLIDSFFHSYKITIGLSGKLFILSTLILISIASYSIITYLLGDTVPGWASTILVIGFLGSMNLAILGMIARVVSVIFDNMVVSQGTFVIENIGFEAS